MTPSDRDLLIGAAGAAVVFHMLTRPVSPGWGPGWMWPIPDLLMAPPLHESLIPAAISQEFRATAPAHLGVDLMYRSWNDRLNPRQGGPAHIGIEFFPRDDVSPPYGWFAPEDTPVCAAKAGTVWSVQESPRGWSVVVDHGPPWATFYQHLAKVSPGISRGARVEAGSQLGTMGSDPTDPQHVRHLHFATWYHGAGDDSSVDPSEAMHSWSRWQWHPPDNRTR
jgi:murein DD-endopeptidase MepM/ murein hydrolase activator NlpD